MSATAEKTDGSALIGLRAEFPAAGIGAFLAALDRTRRIQAGRLIAQHRRVGRAGPPHG
jgi:hypothetical protein